MSFLEFIITAFLADRLASEEEEEMERERLRSELDDLRSEIDDLKSKVKDEDDCP